MNVVPLNTQKLPADLPAELRSLADRIESGAVSEMVVVWVEDGDYKFMWPSSKRDSLILTALAQQTALDRMRA